MRESYKLLCVGLFVVMMCAGCGKNDSGRMVKNNNLVDTVIQKEIDKSNEGDTSVTVTSIDAKENISKDDAKIDVIQEKKSDRNESKADLNVDIDISVMNSDMIYATVYQLVYSPEEYIGQKIKIKGNHYSDYYEETGITYHYALIQDATACCAQGLEFELAEGLVYPNEEDEVIVVGTFDTYEEEGMTYCTLKNAVIE